MHAPTPIDTDDDERECFLSREQICAIVGLSYPTIWMSMRAGEFPRSYKISKTRVGWLRSEIVAWMHSRPLQTYKEGD